MATLPSNFKSALTRRQSVATAIASAASIVLVSRKALADSNIIDVTHAPYNASPSLPDNTSNFQSALNDLNARGGGVLSIPPGFFTLLGQLNYVSANAPITISGYGSALSVLVIKHNLVAINVSYSYVGDNQCLIVKDIGFSPVPSSGLAGTAISLSMPLVTSAAWQSARIENVDFGVQYGGYTSFTQALALTNIWRSRIVNCNSHGNGPSGSVFLSLTGVCIDNRVETCNIDGYNIGVSVGPSGVSNTPSQGLHLTDIVFFGNTAVTTGNSDFGLGTNLLGLYISGCELNCTSTVLSLYQVNSAWISDTDLYGPHAGIASVSCALIGSQRVEMTNCLFGGFFSAGSPSNQVGIMLSSSTYGPCIANKVDECTFENTLVAIDLEANTANFTGLGIRMFAPGNSSLVNTPIVYGTFVQQPLVDNSANLLNTVEWLSTSNATSRTTSTLTIYSR